MRLLLLVDAVVGGDPVEAVGGAARVPAGQNRDHDGEQQPGDDQTARAEARPHAAPRAASGREASAAPVGSR